MKVLGCKPYRPSFIEFHSSTKSGPNGQALLTALHDFTLLPVHLVNSIKIMGGKRLESIVERLTVSNQDLGLIDWFYKTWKRKDSSELRKLSYFADKEGKTRVIAILDY